MFVTFQAAPGYRGAVAEVLPDADHRGDQQEDEARTCGIMKLNGERWPRRRR